MEKTVRKYEVVMIFSITGSDDGAKALSERFKKMVEDNTTEMVVEEWGKRRLAYPINDEPEGYYLLVNFMSDTAFPTELERVLGITDGVLRTMVVRVDE